MAPGIDISAMCEDTSVPCRSGIEMTRKHIRVTLNVGGETFITTSETLSQVPGSLLAQLTPSDSHYDPAAKEYYFDRSAKIFAHILDYYRTNELHFPKCVCGRTLQRELEFWGIPETAISECCWVQYQDYENEQRSLEDLSHLFDDVSLELCYERFYKTDLLINRWRHKLWLILECPRSSVPARVWSLFYMCLLLASIGILCCESHPYFRVPSDADVSSTLVNITNPKVILYYSTELHPVLLWTDSIIMVLFVLEFILKLISWPHHKMTFFTFYNVVDMFSIFPNFTLMIIDIVDPSFWLDNDIFYAYCALSIASTLRAVRVLKIVKQHKGLQIMFLSIKACWKELLLLVMLMAIGMVIFSTMIYYAEFSQENDSFLHIPIGFWWSIVTMTTVGYGDTHPTSGLGYIVGAACAMAGMLATGLPIPMIANSFNMYYTHARIKATIHEREKKIKSEADRVLSQKLSMTDGAEVPAQACAL